MVESVYRIIVTNQDTGQSCDIGTTRYHEDADTIVEALVDVFDRLDRPVSVHSEYIPTPVQD